MRFSPLSREELEAYWRRVISGSGGALGSLVRGILWIASLPYGWITFCLDKAYGRGWLKHQRPQTPFIISVGNIVIGGTGKTPFVLMLAEALNPQTKLAVLTRGYRSLAEKAATPQLFLPGHTPRPTPAVCGDEPCLLMHRLPHAVFAIGRHRRQAAELAFKAGAQLLLLDDGLQHRRLGRDLDIILIDAQAPFGHHYLFPRGLLRESPKALARAGLLVINHAHDKAQFDVISQQLRRYSTAPIIGTQVKVNAVHSLDGELLPSLKNVKVGLFCGIANPEHFRKTVLTLGAQPVAECFSGDHQLPNDELLAAFASRCNLLGASWLLCTEKDRIKLGELPPKLALPIACVSIDLEVVENQPAWLNFLAEVQRNLNLK